MLTFTAGHAYTHGYRRDLPPVQYASNNVAAPVVLAEATFEPSSGESELPRRRARNRQPGSGDDQPLI